MSGTSPWRRRPAPRARALQEGLIPVGATVTVRGNRNRDAKRHEMKTIYGPLRRAASIDVYPERE